MMKSATRFLMAGSVGVLVLGLAGTQAAYAQTLTVKARAFVGKANQCAPSPAGSKIITSVWQNGLGLPDDGTSLNSDVPTNARQGLLLSKNGATENCSAAVADIIGTIGAVPNTIDEFGFDFRNGALCGGGAPRINVVSVVGQITTTYFFGCNAATKSPASQDPIGWTTAVFNAAGAPYAGAETFVFGPGGTPVTSIHIVLDEGTSLGGLAHSVGLAVLDNIKINNTVITTKAATPVQ